MMIEKVIEGIKVNPSLPEDFDCTPHDERDRAELEEWWNVPVVESRIKGYVVRYLDGGAWDRATLKGVFDTLEEAIKKAKEIKQ